MQADKCLSLLLFYNILILLVSAGEEWSTEEKTEDEYSPKKEEDPQVSSQVGDAFGWLHI